MSLIEQHKLVMSSLGDEIGKRMHAVEIKTIVRAG
jgi:stress-induced morphogen